MFGLPTLPSIGIGVAIAAAVAYVGFRVYRTVQQDRIAADQAAAAKAAAQASLVRAGHEGTFEQQQQAQKEQVTQGAADAATGQINLQERLQQAYGPDAEVAMMCIGCQQCYVEAQKSSDWHCWSGTPVWRNTPASSPSSCDDIYHSYGLTHGDGRPINCMTMFGVNIASATGNPFATKGT